HAVIRGYAIGEVLGLDDEPRAAVVGRGGEPRAALRPHPRGAMRTHLEQAPLAPLVALASRGDRAAEPLGLACDALLQARLRGCFLGDDGLLPVLEARIAGVERQQPAALEP